VSNQDFRQELYQVTEGWIERNWPRNWRKPIQKLRNSGRNWSDSLEAKANGEAIAGSADKLEKALEEFQQPAELGKEWGLRAS
jgi:hypothetical protein